MHGKCTMAWTAAALSLGTQMWAATVLFDFGTDAEIAAWRGQGGTEVGKTIFLERSPAFASSGQSALRLHKPNTTWISVACPPPVTDWTKYDRLVLDIMNPANRTQFIAMLIDDKDSIGSGTGFAQMLEPVTYEQVVVDLRKGLSAAKVNPASVVQMRIWTQLDGSDLEALHLDRIVLLEPGEPLPTLPADYVRAMQEVQKRTFALERLGDRLARLDDGPRPPPALAAHVAAERQALDQRLAEMKRQVARAEPAVLGESGTVHVARLADAAERHRGLVGLATAMGALTPPLRVGAGDDAGTVVAVAPAETKVVPRDLPVAATVTRRVEVDLARAETESVQVVVVPLTRALSKVSVRVSAGLTAATGGGKFVAANVRSSVVGFVKTEKIPYSWRFDRTFYTGWRPDPILDFMTETDIAQGDAQSFWLRLRAPRDQAAGVYTGNIEVLVEGKPAFALDLSVRVRSFALPAASPLPLAITFWPRRSDDTVPDDPQHPTNLWREHKLEWVDFLADYYITYTSLYQYGAKIPWEPDFEALTRLQQQGRLGLFNLGVPASIAWQWAAPIEAVQEGIRERLRPRYERARELGLLDHAFIYLCDEPELSIGPQVETAAQAVKQAFPQTPLVAALNNKGLQDLIPTLDVWCPLSNNYHAYTALRERGKKILWYVCIAPEPPFANLWLESAGNEPRLLMGAQTAKHRPDGFLYYQISLWDANRPITSGPFTEWPAVSFRMGESVSHGDGQWTCVGPGGTPLATIRLENFRDGLDDFACYRILETTVAAVEADATAKPAHAEWMKQAKAALVVPDSLGSLTEYSRDPDALQRWRAALADAIEGAPPPAAELPADPWSAGLPVGRKAP